MTTESGEEYQTLFDEKRLYRLLSVKEQKNGMFIFKAELIFKDERGMSDEECEKARNKRLRKYIRERLESDLQMGGYILIGWYQGDFIAPAPNYKKTHGFTLSPGRAAYLPITGSRRVYIWETYGKDAPHPNPVWNNKRFTQFVNISKKPQRITAEKMLALLSAPRSPYEGPCTPNGVWMPAVPLWLIDSKKDMRPLYLAGGKPE
jgi:hypothetical protein